MNAMSTKRRLLVAAVAFALPLGAANAAETIKIGGIAPLSPPFCGDSARCARSGSRLGSRI